MMVTLGTELLVVVDAGVVVADAEVAKVADGLTVVVTGLMLVELAIEDEIAVLVVLVAGAGWS